MNTTDFLIATVDVAIWSTVEPGIGITCAAMACCRPLIRTFLSRSRLWGSSNAPSGTQAWPTSRPSYAGYHRSGSKHVDELELGFHSHGHLGVGKTRGTVTTSGHSQHYFEEEDVTERENANSFSNQMEGNGSTKSLTNATGWTTTEIKLKDNTSDEYPPPLPRKDKLKIGVMTTTEITSAPGPIVAYPGGNGDIKRKGEKKCRF
jgi:hypothetical protein